MGKQVYSENYSQENLLKKIFQQLELRKKQLMSMVLLKIKMEKKKQNLSVFPYLILLGKKNLEQ